MAVREDRGGVTRLGRTAASCPVQTAFVSTVGGHLAMIGHAAKDVDIEQARPEGCRPADSPSAAPSHHAARGTSFLRELAGWRRSGHRRHLAVTDSCSRPARFCPQVIACAALASCCLADTRF